MTSIFLAAAISGLVSGAHAEMSPPFASSDLVGGARPLDDAKDKSKDKEKHACRGQNACKGQGGCKTEKHACKGQNACKGQGGCKG